MTQHRVGTIIEPWMDAAIDKHGQGERVVWDCSIVPIQNSPHEEPKPTCAVMVWFPGPVLGTVVNGSFLIHNPLSTTEEEIDEVMASFLEQLRQARSQQLAQMHESLAEKSRTAQQQPEGLLLP